MGEKKNGGRKEMKIRSRKGWQEDGVEMQVREEIGENRIKRRRWW